jgi:hypothetical protein
MKCLSELGEYAKRRPSPVNPGNGVQTGLATLTCGVSAKDRRIPADRPTLAVVVPRARTSAVPAVQWREAALCRPEDQ